ncbi:hypothetical protein TH4_20995 [Thalassospira tepidiphila MCCC 1A03514]|uniref:Uncharacterized protein n=1 Tax=Thalassospira tepidiphila MCCC 1A03514 TaxID=1177930 RepID=A0A853KV17_9PROT|nr:hypothetical protein TH4_20995 [Thalassospira tepidiphila MCCC 1A03514]
MMFSHHLLIVFFYELIELVPISFGFFRLWGGMTAVKFRAFMNGWQLITSLTDIGTVVYC